MTFKIVGGNKNNAMKAFWLDEVNGVLAIMSPISFWTSPRVIPVVIALTDDNTAGYPPNGAITTNATIFAEVCGRSAQSLSFCALRTRAFIAWCLWIARHVPGSDTWQPATADVSAKLHDGRKHAARHCGLQHHSLRRKSC